METTLQKPNAKNNQWIHKEEKKQKQAINISTKANEKWC